MNLFFLQTFDWRLKAKLNRFAAKVCDYPKKMLNLSSEFKTEEFN